MQEASQPLFSSHQRSKAQDCHLAFLISKEVINFEAIQKIRDTLDQWFSTFSSWMKVKVSKNGKVS